MSDIPPAVIQAGLSRSGSTLAWQVCKTLVSPREAAKTHGYNPTHKGIPVIVTVRHPCDAAISYHQASSKEDKVSSGAFGPILSSSQNILRWVQHHDCLVIKYEEWFPDVRQVVRQIANHLEIALHPNEIDEVANKHSYIKNYKHAQKQGEWKNYDPDNHIHGNHLNGGQGGS